jgi:phenylpropionate dioxygenase-like ring-hydroxylating dioxygenase large terminal subunit
MDSRTQTELTTKFFGYLANRTTDYAEAEMRIPTAAYYEPAHAAAERDLVFKRMPLLIAHSSELSQPGAFVSRDLVGTPLLVVRQDDGSLRAFSNVCRHRGAQVVDVEKGCARSFRCPYHAWSYSLDGSLRSIPFGEGFDKTDRSEHGLIELPVDERHGLVWVMLTPGPPLDIAAHIGAEADTEMASFELHDYTLVRQATFDEPMNWKISADGFLDTYHLQFVHPKTVGPFFNTNVYDLEVFAPHVARLVVARKSMNDVVELDAAEVDLLAHVLLAYLLLPCTYVTFEPEHVEVWQLSPHPTDPGRSRITIRFLLPQPPQNDREERYLERNWNLLLRTVVDEDWPITRRMQQAVTEGRVPEFVLGRNEAPVQFLHSFLARRLADHPDPAGIRQSALAAQSDAIRV